MERKEKRKRKGKEEMKLYSTLFIYKKDDKTMRGMAREGVGEITNKN